jgi:hypothetical protein
MDKNKDFIGFGSKEWHASLLYHKLFMITRRFG